MGLNVRNPGRLLAGTGIELVMAIGTCVMPGIAWGQNAAPQASGCSADAMPVLHALWAEMRSLRKEFLEDRRVMQQAKLQEAEKQLEAIQAQQRELDLEQSSRTNQLAEIETQLQSPGLGKNEREDLESQKSQLLSLPAEPSSIVQTALSQRETRVRDRLAEQEQRLRALDQLIRQLSTDVR